MSKTDTYKVPMALVVVPHHEAKPSSQSKKSSRFAMMYRTSYQSGLPFIHGHETIGACCECEKSERAEC